MHPKILLSRYHYKPPLTCLRPMFHLWNNGELRTKISESNGGNINTIDDNFTTWFLKNTKQG